MCFPYKRYVSLNYKKLPEAFCMYIASRVYENIIIRPIFIILKNNRLNKLRAIIA